MSKYELTPEHRAQLGPWAEKWTKIIMSTSLMTENDKEQCRHAVNGLYQAANLPLPKHIIFVPSPFVLAFAGGFAAAIWHLSKNNAARDAAVATNNATKHATMDAARDATNDAINDATDNATRHATWNAIYNATYNATSYATNDATINATRNVTHDTTINTTRNVTHDTTYNTTYNATYNATDNATSYATRDATMNVTDIDSKWYPELRSMMYDIAKEIAGDKADFLMECAKNHQSMWNGGNQWAQYVSFISFFRYVSGLQLDYSKWDHYEVLATLSGPRIMHADFCMISDKPEILTADSQNRPHNDTGPFCRWSDGTSLYAIHGTYVPAWVIEHPERITTQTIEAENNAEIRRIMVEKYGLSKYVRDAKFEVVDSDKDPLGQPRRLLKRNDLLVVELTNSTKDGDGSRRVYHVPCHPELRPLLPNGELGERQKLTALNAVASTYGMCGKDYKLEVET